MRSATPKDTEAVDPAKRSPDGQPTEQELRISARLLLHIARQPRVGFEDIPTESLTQAGMAKALGTVQPIVSNALRRLVDGGALRVERRHVQHRWNRLKVYQLTPEGERLVRQIRLRFGVA